MAALDGVGNGKGRAEVGRGDDYGGEFGDIGDVGGGDDVGGLF